MSESKSSDKQAAFTHFDASGRPQMVDVSEKAETRRTAVAEAFVRMQVETRHKIEDRAFAKGDVLSVAELAGIMAAKRTSDLIPLCHPLPLTKVTVRCAWEEAYAPTDASSTRLHIEATVETTYKTGVEMEALTASSVAALTVYDMCKSADRAMRIEEIGLVYKSGGKSGVYKRITDA